MDRAIKLLMIEDNPGDIRLSQEYLKTHEAPNHLYVITDDVEILSFLRGQGICTLATPPDIILISIRVIWMKDKHLFIKVKNYADLNHIPVVIMTCSEGEETSLDNDLACSLCLTKPLNVDELFTIVKDTGTVVRLEN